MNKRIVLIFSILFIQGFLAYSTEPFKPYFWTRGIFNVPENWSDISSDTLAKYFPDKSNAGKSIYRFGFQPSDASADKIRFPYFVVRIYQDGPVSHNYLSRFDTFPRSFDKMKNGKTYYSPSLQRFFRKTIFPAGSINIVCIRTQIPTNFGNIAIYGYSVKKDFYKRQQVFSIIMNKSCVTNSFEYKPAYSALKSFFCLPIVISVLFLIILTVLIVKVNWLKIFYVQIIIGFLLFFIGLVLYFYGIHSEEILALRKYNLPEPDYPITMFFAEKFISLMKNFGCNDNFQIWSETISLSSLLCGVLFTAYGLSLATASFCIRYITSLAKTIRNNRRLFIITKVFWNSRR